MRGRWPAAAHNERETTTMKADNAMTTVRSAHPVDPAVRVRVMAELAEVERRHDVSVLFACESDSRGWKRRNGLQLLRRLNSTCE